MKRFLIIIAMTAVFAAAHAQQGLYVNELFQGKIIPKEQMMEIAVRGKSIAKYQLTYFHSLRFIASGEEFSRIKMLVEKDHEANMAESGGEGSYSITNKKSGKEVISFMLRLKPLNGKNRYLCYKTTGRNGKTYETTVVYMEGSLPSLDKLKSILQVTIK